MADPKAELERKARELREQREASSRTADESRKAWEDAKQNEMASVSVWRVRKAVARPFTAFLGGCGIVFAGMYFATPGNDSVLLVFTIACLVLGAWFATGLVRWRIWRGRLPFRVEGDMHALGLGAAVKTAEVSVTFRDTAIPKETFAELLQAKVPGSTHVDTSPSTIVIQSPTLETEGSNWPLAGWFRKVAGGVLADIHPAYAIEKVSVRSLTTTEFHVPSGD